MLFLRESLHCHIYHVPVVCSDHLDLFTYIMSRPLRSPTNMTPLPSVSKVMRSLSNGATRHEKKSMILKVNLVTIEEHTAPIAHAVVLKEASANDVVR